MASTPPPPTRLHTPPAPRHGPRHDDTWSPYSPPRRSARVSAHQQRYPSSPEPSKARGKESSDRDNHMPQISTPAARKRTLMKQASSQTLSPPSSPESFTKNFTPRQKNYTPRQSTTQHVAARQNIAQSDFTVAQDQSDLAPDGVVMLPTPNKTPRKRASATLASTSRILNFQAADPSGLMPTPRKRRQPLTLDSFDEEEAAQQDKIEIFTDSHDRVPDVEMSDENPFLGPRKARKPAKSVKGRKTQKQMELDDEEAEMERAVRNDEGIIYTFRGKKILRRFETTNANRDGGANGDMLVSQDSNIRHQAGATMQRPFTRSSIQPRLLFPSQEQLDERDVIEEDEEAPTDIEEDTLLPRHPVKSHTATFATQTPKAKAAHTNATTPSSHSAKRATRHTERLLLEADQEGGHTEMLTPQMPTKPKKTSPFDSWQRRKPGVAATASQGTKRAAPPSEDTNTGKRTRSAAH